MGSGDLLRGDYKQSEYGKVVLPLTVLRRFDCVLELTKGAVLARAEKLRGRVENMEPVLCAVSGEQFFNVSPLNFRRLLDDPGQVAGNLRAYMGSRHFYPYERYQRETGLPAPEAVVEQEPVAPGKFA